MTRGQGPETSNDLEDGKLLLWNIVTIGTVRITPVAPLSAMTMETMKKPSATIPRDSLHVRPKRHKHCCCRTGFDIHTNCNNTGSKLPGCGTTRAVKHSSPVVNRPSYLKASDIQYAMNEVTPHLRPFRGTGSKSLFVLIVIYQ